MAIEKIIETLQLLPHPEGGYYRETYRSSMMTGNPDDSQARSLSTGIYFMLTSVNFSALHRIKSDEMWHFYAGNPLEIVEITPAGDCILTRLGNDLARGDVPQYVVKAGHWFGSRVYEGGQYSLVGCTVAPGFDFADFEMGNRLELINHFPRHAAIIDAMTRD